MGKIERIQVAPEDRERLVRLVRDRNTPQKIVWRSQIVLLAGEGMGAAPHTGRLPSFGNSSPRGSWARLRSARSGEKTVRMSPQLAVRDLRPFHHIWDNAAVGSSEIAAFRAPPP